MKILLKNANVFLDETFKKSDIAIENEYISNISSSINQEGFDFIFDFNNLYVLPGLIDVHTHLREPGFLYKETIETGTRAAARGGYTSICTMPNLNPTPDCIENLDIQIKAIKDDAIINVYPYGTITKGELGEELSKIEEIKDKVIAFSDDGKGVQKEEIMLEAMNKIKAINKIIAAHCEDNSLLNGGYIHDGEYAKIHNHRGICSESEWGPIKRDIELVRQTNCKYHICHISTKESVELVRKAKKEGLPVTCETAPHYLCLDDMDLKEEGRFKMNPPIRSKEDREALIEGIKDGTIDMIATDHAPHSKEEKSKGLEGSLMGVVGLEVAFPALYTNLVKTGIITMEKLVELMNTNPRNIFNIGTKIAVGEKADLAVMDLEKNYNIDPEEFKTKGRSTPFEGMNVFGICKMTIVNGKIVWEDK